LQCIISKKEINSISASSRLDQEARKNTPPPQRLRAVKMGNRGKPRKTCGTMTNEECLELFHQEGAVQSGQVLPQEKGQ